MRLICETESSDRRLPSLGHAGKKAGWARTSLSIGRHCNGTNSTATDVVHVLLCTAQNRSGTKYRVAGNVRHVFRRFVSEGKATLSFETPPLDIFLRKADPLQLRTFVKVLLDSSTVTNGTIDYTLGRLRPATASQIRSPKTKMVINEKRSYPICDGFPSSLVVLHVNNCCLKKVDSRMLTLNQLRELDLSDNVLHTLPDELGAALPRLRMLNVSRNQLVCLSPSSLGRLLTDLDLSHNRLETLPIEACHQLAEHLRTLKLDNNRMSSMPERVHLWRNLRTLSASNNLLRHLPTGFLHLRLDSIDVTRNPFVSNDTSTSPSFPSDVVSTLLELAARTILRFKLSATEEDLPTHLIEYLAEDKMCPCGIRFVRSPTDAVIKHMDLHRIASAIVADVDGGTCAPVCLRLCSRECTKRFTKPY